jgi:hemerythrin-like domain-containing protein
LAEVEPEAMDALSLLKRDHAEIVAGLHDLIRTRPFARQRRMAEDVLRAIEVHGRIEEEIFYPALRARADRRSRLHVVEAIEEHRIIDDLLRRLETGRLDDASYEARLLLLREHVEHHVEREERMFPEARRLLGDELADLGERMRARSRQLGGAGARRRPVPPDAPGGTALHVVGGAASRPAPRRLRRGGSRS